MLFTDLTYDCLEKVFNFVPLKDQLTCVEVWPEWRGNILLSHKQLTIGNIGVDVDELSEEIVFGENGIGLLKVLNYLYNLEELVVENYLGNKYQQQIVKDIGRERRKLRVIKLGRCDEVDYETFKRMVDSVPQLEEFRGSFGHSTNTGDSVRYLLTRAKQLHSLDLSGSDKLTSDVFKGAGVRLKVLKARMCDKLDADVLDHILESSRATLEEVELSPSIPYSRFKTLSKFNNLKKVSSVFCSDEYFLPLSGPTEVSSLLNLHHLQKIDIGGCFHDEDIRSISRSWKDMRELKLEHVDDTSQQPSYAALMSLMYMTSIEKMELWDMKNLTDDHIEVLSRELVNLKVLKLENTSATGKGLRYLAKLPHIQRIMCCNSGDVNIFASGEEKEEVISVLNFPRRENGRKFKVVFSSHNALHLMDICVYHL